MSNNQNEFPRNLGMYLSDFLVDRREKQRYLASRKKKNKLIKNNKFAMLEIEVF